MNIGITFGFLTPDTNIWINKSVQNVVFLYLLLSKIKEFNVYLINFGIDFDKLSLDNQRYLSDIKIINWVDVKDKIIIDIFIESGLKIKTKDTDYLRSRKCKIIRFETENNYMVDTEEIIFKQNNEEIVNDKYDVIWILDNNQRMNKHYLEELYKVPIVTMPFIWNPHFVEKEKALLRSNKIIMEYLPHDKKDITIFESNDSINKMSLYPLIILEKAYNFNKKLFQEKVGKIRVINSIKFRNNARYLSIVNRLNIKLDGYCAFEDIYNVPIILSQFTDIVISAQWENPLDFSYFETLYGHYPLLHNSDNFKPNQYYYPELNFQAAVEKLFYIIENHDRRQIDYNIRVDGILQNYSINNQNTINNYKINLTELQKK